MNPDFIGWSLIITGALFLVAGGSRIIVLAYQGDRNRGIKCLWSSTFYLRFVFSNWRETELPFALQILGGLFEIFGGYILNHPMQF